MFTLFLRSRPKLGVLLLVGGYLIGNFVRPALFQVAFARPDGIAWNAFDTWIEVFWLFGWACHLARWAGVLLLLVYVKNKIMPASEKSLSAFGSPVTAGFVKEKFTGFDVSKDSFRTYKGNLYYVSPEGVRINLKAWHFDDKTGEFYKITDRDKSVIKFSYTTYKERLSNRLTTKRMIQSNLIISAIGAVMVVIVFTFGQAIYNYGPGFPLGLGILGFGFLGGGVVLLLGAIKTSVMNKEFYLTDTQVGPPPMARDMSNFGPSSAASPVEHPAGDELSYRPAT